MKNKEWLNIWLENYIKPTAKLRTYESYKNIVHNKISGALAEKELGEISTLDIQQLVTKLLRDGIAASSINTIISVLQNSLQSAMMLGYLENNVVKNVKRPKITGKEVTCFTLYEQRKIECAILDDPRSKMFGIILCLYTGLRIGELLSLTWSDIDLQKCTLSVNRTCYDKQMEHGYKRILGEPKTTSSKRKIPLPTQLIPYLRKLKKSEKSKYVVSFHGQPIGMRSYQRSFALLLNKINVKHKCFHSLRHTFATRALECGMDVKTLSEILGHKSATITLNKYAHSLFEHKKNMMDRLGEIFMQ